MIGWLILLIILATMFLLPIGIAAHFLSVFYNRKDKLLRDEAEAHRKILEGTYDYIWNNIKQRTGIKEECRRSFNNVYPDLLNKSIDNENFINWILDCNIDFNPQEYAPLLELIVMAREKFVFHQIRMENLIKEHRVLLSGRPAKWLIRDKSAIVYVPMETDYTRWGRAI